MYSAISSSRPLAYLHSFPISLKSLHSLQIPLRGADIGGLWTSGADGFSAATPARIAATTAVAAEHLPKVIRRQVYYGSESSCQVPIYPDLFTMSKVWLLTESVLNDPPPPGKRSATGSGA